MLPGAGLGDDARLAEALGEERLADAVVDLVRARVVQVLAFQPDLRAARFFGPALRVVDGGRPANVVLELIVEFGDERGIVAVMGVLLAELVECADQRFGDEHAAVRTEMPAGVGQVIRKIGHLHCALPR